MHEGVRASEAGECKLCGMPLVAIDTKPRTALHDANYDMLLSAPSREPGSASVMINLTPQRDGATLCELATVHEHTLHLIIVSQDLSFFDHVHPVPQPDGSFTLPYRFPAGGSYILFADITPRGDRSQVFRMPLEIGPHRDNPANYLAVSPAQSKLLASDPAITVALHPTPRALTAGTHAQLLFNLAKDDKPVTDLAPYLGAMGHCVVISQDTQTYLHCHPEQLLTPKASDTGGPGVPFHLRFPAPGRYKVWGQFKRGDKILVADFVVDVSAPLLGPKVMQMLFDE